MCVGGGTEEGSQLGRVPPDQRVNIDDTCGGSIRRELDRPGAVLVMDVENERRQNNLDDNEVRAVASVGYGVQGSKTRSLEADPCRSEGSGGRGYNELGGEGLGLNLGRDGVMWGHPAPGQPELQSVKHLRRCVEHPHALNQIRKLTSAS